VETWKNKETTERKIKSCPQTQVRETDFSTTPIHHGHEEKWRATFYESSRRK
jgi:hypothetical protein